MEAVHAEERTRRPRGGALLPWLLVLFVFASRLPYLRPGYGTDPDAYRVILAARTLRGGEYTASRLPGYPLHELLTALLLPGGPCLVNGASALVSALAALALLKLGEALGLSLARASWLALAFAFTPLVFQNSTCSIDYVWSICCVLWSAYALVSGHSLRAGLLLGAAVGMRITAGAMLLPWLVLQHGMLDSAPRWSQHLRLCLATGASGALFFAPVLYTYGFGFLTFVDHDVSWSAIAMRATTEVWGSLGVFAWCGVLAIAVFAWRHLLAALRRARALALAAWLAVALFGVAFLRLPHEAAYLIPCVPFLLLLTAALLPTLAIAELALLLGLSCFVSLDAQGLSTPGPVPAARVRRIELNRRAGRVLRRMAANPGKALIIAGTMQPCLDVQRGSGEQPQHRYLYLLQSEEELHGYQQQGYELYFVDRSTERLQRRLLGFSLLASGGRSIL
jgi:hypothetical protein